MVAVLLELEPPWPMMTPHGEGIAKVMVHLGADENCQFGIRIRGGHFKFYWQSDVRLVGLVDMDGHGYDLDLPEDWKQ